MKIALLLFCGSLLPLSSLAATPPGFEPAKFKHLIAVAAEKGDFMHTGEQFDFKTLTHIVPSDVKAPHRADSFSDLGGLDSDGHFGTGEVN